MKSRLILSVFLVTVGIRTQAQVHVDFDKHIDFKKYKTFQFEPGSVIRNLGGKDTDATFVNKYVSEEVSKHLAAKGMSPASSNPDLVVTFLAGAREKQDVQTFMNTPGYMYPYSRFYGYSGWWGPQWNNFWVHKYEEGTIIVDVYDTKSKQLVWRSYAVSPINKFNEQKFVEKQIKKSFKNFPPSH